MIVGIIFTMTENPPTTYLHETHKNNKKEEDYKAKSPIAP